MGRRLRTTGLAAATCGLVAATAVTAGPAEAAPDLTCGAVVRTSVVLRHDLTCPGDGLTVVAAGVTVDLRGHRLSGAGSGTGIAIATDDSAPVTVTDGTVDHFGSAVRVGASVRLQGLAVTGSTTGFDGQRASWASASVLDSRFSGNQTAVVAVGPGGRALTVSGTTFEGNAVGVALRDVTGVVVTDSRFISNTSGFTAYQSDGHRLARNVFRGNTVPIQLTQSRANRVTLNRVTENVNGLVLSGVETQGNVITGNEFSGNQTFGARVGDGTSDINGTVVDANVFSGNGAAGLWFQGAYRADGSRITRNAFLANGFHPGGLVDENGAPLDDGLHVFNPASAGVVTLRDDVAVGNAGHGIEAAVVVDGGGNRELRNGAGPGLVP